ncbi:MAG: hypothetical protein WCA32_06135 [Chromatiaceae bacterium]|jgi:uncharacterized protein YutE (UPF0331/DUF86 family)
MADKLHLLRDELRDLDRAAGHLRLSIDRTRELSARDASGPEELERLEALASRFARLSDLLTQRVMRLVDEVELLTPGTLLDRIRRAEKRGWVDEAARLVRIRELRNLIAHEYASEKLAGIYAAVITLAPELLAVVPKVQTYAQDLINKYPVSPDERT